MYYIEFRKKLIIIMCGAFRFGQRLAKRICEGGASWDIANRESERHLNRTMAIRYIFPIKVASKYNARGAFNNEEPGQLKDIIR